MRARNPDPKNTDLMTFLEDARGDVVPHAQSVRPHVRALVSLGASESSRTPATAIEAVLKAQNPDLAADEATISTSEVVAEAALADRRAGRRRERKAARVALKADQRTVAPDGPRSIGPPGTAFESEVRYLTVKEVARRFGVGRATIWRWGRTNPDFPKPVRPGPGVTRWPLDEVIAFESTIKERRS